MSFGLWVTRRVKSFEDPDSPSKKVDLDQPAVVAGCIDAILLRTRATDSLADLGRRLEEATQYLDGETLSVRELILAVKLLAENFENWLKAIALIKYASREELLFGTREHVGFLATPLGGLLLGLPAARPGISDTDKAKINKARIVKFAFGGRELSVRLYDRVRVARNAVHNAKEGTVLDLIREAQHIVAAYALAIEENLDHLGRALDPNRELLQATIEDTTGHLPFTIEARLSGKLSGSGDAALRLTDIMDVAGQRPVWLAVTGEPGAGKTTLTKQLANSLAISRLAAPFSSLPIPVYLQASTYSGEQSLLALVAAKLGIEQTDLEREWRSINVILLLDGVNEIQSRLYRQANAEIRALATFMPAWSIIYTSRFRNVLPTADFVDLRVQPFDDAQMWEYLQLSLGGEKIALTFYEELRSIPRLLTLCRNPLVLYMLLDISGDTLRVPENRGKLLQEFMTRFLDREKEALTPIEPATIRSILAMLAFEMRSNRTVAISERVAQRLVSPLLSSLQSGIGVIDLFSACIHAGLLYRIGGEQVTFFHELIQEYFAALVLADRFESSGVIPQSIATDPWWEQVLVIAYGLTENSQRVLSELAGKNVGLSAQCVMDAPSPRADDQLFVVTEAQSDLQSASHLGALQALATIWTPEAQEVVASELRGKGETTSFLQRFSEDAFAAAVDLLGLVKQSGAIAGLVATIRDMPDKNETRIALGRELLAICARTASADQLPFAVNQCELLFREAKWESTDSAAIANEVSRLFGGAVNTHARLLSCIRSRLNSAEHDAVFAASYWRINMASLAIEGCIEELLHASESCSAMQGRWLAPLLLASRENIEDWRLLERITDSLAKLVALPSNDESEPTIVEQVEAAADRQRVSAHRLPTAGRWQKMSEEARDRWCSRAIKDKNMMHRIDAWPEGLLAGLKQFIMARIPEKRMPLPKAVWNKLGLPDEGAGIARERLHEMTTDGRAELATQLSTKWKTALASPTAPSVPSVGSKESGNGPPNFSELSAEELESWFTEEVKAGRVADLLASTHRIRARLASIATINAAEQLEKGNTIVAGQLIVAFRLRDQFPEVVGKLAADLMRAGKTGLSQELAPRKGASAAAVDEAAIERLREYLSNNQFGSAQSLLQHGFGYLEGELRRVIEERFAMISNSRDGLALAELLNSCDISAYISKKTIVLALEGGGVWVHATVHEVKAAGHAVLWSERYFGKIHCARAVTRLVKPQLIEGERVLMSVTFHGSQVVARAIRRSHNSSPWAIALTPEHGTSSVPDVMRPRVSRPDGPPSEDAIAALSRSWRAKLRH
jgi:hypothetical protein